MAKANITMMLTLGLLGNMVRAWTDGGMSQESAIMRRESSASDLQTDPTGEVTEAAKVVSPLIMMQDKADEASDEIEMILNRQEAQVRMDAVMKNMKQALAVVGQPQLDHGPRYTNLGPKACRMVAMVNGINNQTCVETCEDDSDPLRMNLGMKLGDCLSHGFYPLALTAKFNSICMGIHNVSYYEKTSAETGGSQLTEGVHTHGSRHTPANDGCGDVYHMLNNDAKHCQTLCVGDASTIQDKLGFAGGEPSNCTASDVGYTGYLGTMEVRIVIRDQA